MTLNLINRVEHQRKEPPPVSGILKKYYRGQWRNIFNFDHRFSCLCLVEDSDLSLELPKILYFVLIS